MYLHVLMALKRFSNLRAAFIIILCSTIVMWMDCIVHHCPISLSMAISIYSVVGTHIASTGCSSDAAATSRGGKKQDAHSHSHCSKRRAFGKIRTKEECVVCVCAYLSFSLSPSLPPPSLLSPSPFECLWISVYEEFQDRFKVLKNTTDSFFH